MIRPIASLRKKRILIDVDTQCDLFLAKGKACVHNHRSVRANIERIMAWARCAQIHVISTAQVHLSASHNRGFCLAGTDGICKLHDTLRDRHIVFDSGDSTDWPCELLLDLDQIILCKRTEDPFEEPRAERILTEIKASEFIIIGGPTESAVLYTVLGLLQRNKTVTVITDAIGSHEKKAARLALRKMKAKGAKLIDIKSFLDGSDLSRVKRENEQSSLRENAHSFI